MNGRYQNKPTKEGRELLEAVMQACREEYCITYRDRWDTPKFKAYFAELQKRMAFEGYDVRGAELQAVH